MHPETVREWADKGKLPVVWVGRERRFKVSDVEALIRGGDPQAVDERVAGYVRVSGSTGQGSSVETQRAELEARFGDRLVKVYSDRGSGLNEKRRGLGSLLEHAAEGRFGVVAVTHQDRLARFGVPWIEQILFRDGVRVEVLHPKGSAGGMPELLDDFMSLVATFAGRMYGIRSAETKRRLLTEAGREVPDG